MERCKEHIKSVIPDIERVKGLKKVADARIKALRQIRADSETSTIIVEQYYEAIKELLTALLLKNGKKSDNHECLIEYFRQNFNYPYEAQMLQEIRKLRNKINYEGLLIPQTYLERNKLELEHITRLLGQMLE